MNTGPKRDGLDQRVFCRRTLLHRVTQVGLGVNLKLIKHNFNELVVTVYTIFHS
jgi:hypothetical protein